MKRRESDRMREREKVEEKKGWKQDNELTYQKGGRTELGKYDLLIFYFFLGPHTFSYTPPRHGEKGFCCRKREKGGEER